LEGVEAEDENGVLMDGEGVRNSFTVPILEKPVSVAIAVDTASDLNEVWVEGMLSGRSPLFVLFVDWGSTKNSMVGTYELGDLQKAMIKCSSSLHGLIYEASSKSPWRKWGKRQLQKTTGR